MLDRSFVVRTPESVEFAFLEAGAWTRFLAWWVDATLIGAIFIAGVVGLTLLAGVTFGLAAPLLFIFSFLLTSGYFIWCEWRMGGSSPGKRLFRLRVIRDDGLKLSFAASVIRNLLRVADSLPVAYAVAMVIAALSEGTRRLGDHVAGTRVVVEPQAPRPGALSAELRASLSALPELRARLRRESSAEERDLLLSAVLRREQLRTAARIEIFAALARHFADKLALDKPAHLSDERFACDLAAVLLD